MPTLLAALCANETSLVVGGDEHMDMSITELQDKINSLQTDLQALYKKEYVYRTDISRYKEMLNKTNEATRQNYRWSSNPEKEPIPQEKANAIYLEVENKYLESHSQEAIDAMDDVLEFGAFSQATFLRAFLNQDFWAEDCDIAKAQEMLDNYIENGENPIPVKLTFARFKEQTLEFKANKPPRFAKRQPIDYSAVAQLIPASL